MSKLDRLIEELCPDGVEYKNLGNIVNIVRGERVTKKQLLPDGIYPVISGGVTPMGYLDKKNRNGNTITIAQYGTAGTILWQQKDFWANDVCYTLEHIKETSQRYLYHVLLNLQFKIDMIVNRDAVPYHLPSVALKKISIPLPPLPIQKEIVRILDKFTELTTVLTEQLITELTARKKQYEYYRDELLTFGDEVEWKELREIGELIRGSGLLKSDFKEKGFPCIHYGQIHTYYGTSADKTISFVSYDLSKKLKKAKKGDVLIAGVSENVEDICKPLAWQGGDVAIGGDMFAFRHKQNTKYIAYLLQTSNFSRYKERFAHGAKVTRLRQDKLLSYKIPIPPLAEQERIVAILDKFDALVNDISIGLPAEIEARQKQYEYYRDKLLTFNEKPL